MVHLEPPSPCRPAPKRRTGRSSTLRSRADRRAPQAGAFLRAGVETARTSTTPWAADFSPCPAAVPPVLSLLEGERAGSEHPPRARPSTALAWVDNRGGASPGGGGLSPRALRSAPTGEHSLTHGGASTSTGVYAQRHRPLREQVRSPLSFQFPVERRARRRRASPRAATRATHDSGVRARASCPPSSRSGAVSTRSHGAAWRAALASRPGPGARGCRFPGMEQ